MPEALATTRATSDGLATRRGAAVASLAMAAPPEAVDNAPIADRLGISERWIVERTGVDERRVAAHGDRLASYAAEAGSAALDDAGVDAAELDLVIVATMSHEQLTPHAAALVTDLIGATRSGAIDLNAACTGFLSALSMADRPDRERQARARRWSSAPT